MKKKLIGAVLVVIVGIGIFLFTRPKAAPVAALQKVTVAQGNLAIAFAIDGATVIDRREPSFTVSGKVVHIAVTEGQEVTKGQYLASLDTADVQKNLERTLKDFSISRTDFDQTTQTTYPSGAVSETIERILAKNQFNLDKAVLDVELKDIALKESYLYAPIDGVVSEIAIHEGESVSSQNNTPIFIITQPNSLSFEAFAEDVEVLKISKDQKVSVKLDAIANTVFSAKVTYISHLATIDQNGIATYKITATLDNPKDLMLLDAMPGQITFTTKEKQNVLIIPNQSVHRVGGVSYVTRTIAGSNKTEEVTVTTGFTDGKSVEVVQGLQKGDVILSQ